ncbi:MAG: cytochrome-c oxidase, cbb3-type subunit I [Opitutales bacterium]
MSENNITIEYNDKVVRWFMLVSIVWGVVGLLAGVIIAGQLNFWQLNFGMEWLTFGRLRPLHTNAAIFAFVGNMMFAGIYYSTQRLCKVRLASDLLSWIHFWGWQLIIVAAAITIPLGYSRGQEYAELIWPINIAVALIWVIFAINFFWTIGKRNEPTLYVAVWFYIATIVTVAMLYVVNHLSLPTGPLHSYSLFAGFKGALVQWWYGHNAVAFFLTTPILGIMYYFLPKAAERPVYSYRLSIIHFWSLIFIYIWAGPHHLLNTALPSWLQALGMIFSLMLWAPSWGGMLNGLLTLKGAWMKLREDPVLKFFAAGVTFYGMATFEGPLLSIKAVNSLSHYSDWTIGHVHSGTLGWNGFMAAGMFYWLAPRLWNTKLYSKSMANMHFWTGMVGILLYVAAMWVTGITQGLMLNAMDETGTTLQYPKFVETLAAIKPMMLMRLIGGGLYLFGWLALCYNIFMTVKSGTPVNGSIEVPAKYKNEEAVGNFGAFINWPVTYSSGLVIFSCLWIFGQGLWMIIGLMATATVCLVAVVHFKGSGATWGSWYEKFCANSLAFTILTFISVAIGGALQIIPSLTINEAKNHEGVTQSLYSPLELAGRDIYVSEGCYNCHSQMVRTLVPDVIRYGNRYSKLGDSIYDHPFQWGSKRSGPDLAHIGALQSELWHYRHLMNPRAYEEASNMPAYPWLAEKKVEEAVVLKKKIDALRILGVPYPEMSETVINGLASKQAMAIHNSIKGQGEYVEPDTQMVALIAYLRKLGRVDESTIPWSPDLEALQQMESAEPVAQAK